MIISVFLFLFSFWLSRSVEDGVVGIIPLPCSPGITWDHIEKRLPLAA